MIMRRATPIRLQAIAVAVLFLAASASASHIRVAVDTVPVSAGTGPEFLRIAFADEPLLATVTIGVYTIPDRPSSALGFRALSELDPRVWWRSIEWTVTNTATKASYVIPGAAVEVVRATTDPIAVNGTSEHRGTFRLNGIA